MTIERVLARDDEGRFVETSLGVRRRIDINVSCSCWRHRLPFPIEMIETFDGLYFRPGKTDELFREIGMNGPITIEVERIVKES
jgi:hypothetical protein